MDGEEEEERKGGTVQHCAFVHTFAAKEKGPMALLQRVDKETIPPLLSPPNAFLSSLCLIYIR